MEGNNKLKKLQIQRNIIIVIASLILVACTIGLTLSWYTRRAQDSANIVFSNPVEIYITGADNNMEEEIVPKSGKILPGARVKVQAGFQLGKEDKPSSPAFVRARLSVTCNEVTDEQGNPLKESLIENGSLKPYGSNWKLVSFTNAHGTKENWFVLANSNGLAETVTNLQKETFYNGEIEISKDLDNRYANANIKIFFEVEAIQSDNVQNPLLNYNNPTWGVAA